LGGATIEIGDALEILKFLAGIDNVIALPDGTPNPASGGRAFRAAIIAENREPADLNTPTIMDALEVLKFLAGIPNDIDEKE
jgi:hypothetical protein